MNTSPARELALKVLRQVEVKGVYANYLLDREFQRLNLSKSDQKLAYLLVYGILRHRNRLDWTINYYSDYPLEDLTAWIRNDLRIGVYQLLDMPDLRPSVAVNESTQLAHKFGHKGTASFVNAILRKVTSEGQPHLPTLDEDPEVHLVIAQSHPQWLVKRWLKRYGPNIAYNICYANNHIPPLTIRANRIKSGHYADWQNTLEGPIQSKEIPEGFIIQGPRPIKSHKIYKEGVVDLQTISSMLMSHLLCVNPGERVLDVCAGSGGKSCHMADLMKNKGEILCIDKNKKKLDALYRRARRLDVKICYPVCSLSNKEYTWKEGIFHKVLVDAPCSALGIIKRHPEIRWLRKEEDIFVLAQKQRQILSKAAKALSKGGRLLYCTCSLEQEETDDILEDFLKTHPQFELVNLKQNIPKQWNDMVEDRGIIRLMPFLKDIDGFFAFSVTK